MKFILNIGLKSSKGDIKPGAAVHAIHLNNLQVLEVSLQQSETEPTLVVEVETLHSKPLWFIASIDRLAQELHQDCIAVYRPETDRGALIGPKAAEWGNFDPKQFLLLDGRNLQLAQDEKLLAQLDS